MPRADLSSDRCRDGAGRWRLGRAAGGFGRAWRRRTRRAQAQTPWRPRPRCGWRPAQRSGRASRPGPRGGTDGGGTGGSGAARAGPADGRSGARGAYAHLYLGRAELAVDQPAAAVAIGAASSSITRPAGIWARPRLGCWPTSLGEAGDWLESADAWQALTGLRTASLRRLHCAWRRRPKRPAIEAGAGRLRARALRVARLERGAGSRGGPVAIRAAASVETRAAGTGARADPLTGRRYTDARKAFQPVRGRSDGD